MEAYHVPPRAVGMPRAFKAPATPCRVVIPDRCMSRAHDRQDIVRELIGLCHAVCDRVARRLCLFVLPGRHGPAQFPAPFLCRLQCGLGAFGNDTSFVFGNDLHELQHGAVEAEIHAAQRVDALLEQGDMDGRRVWLRVLDAVKEFSDTVPTGVIH